MASVGFFFRFNYIVSYFVMDFGNAVFICFYLERFAKDHKNYIKGIRKSCDLNLNERLYETELELKYGDKTLNRNFVKDEDWIGVLED